MTILSADQLKTLTDRAHPGDQIEWLRENDWRFVVSAAGRPKVDIAEYERHMVGGGSKQQHPTPDLSWFHGQKTASQ